MIAALAADEARPGRLAIGLVKGARDLECGIDRFRVGIGEEGMVEVAGQHVHQARRELELTRMRHPEAGRLVHALRLALHCFDDFAPPMSGIDTPQTGGAFENLAVIDATVVHAFGRHQETGIGLELPVGRKRYPQGVESQLDVLLA